MPRRHLPELPDFEGSIRNWAISYITKNIWRFRPLYDYEDLIQDAYMKYLQCYRKYAHIQDRPHFKRLFQVAFKNHLNDLSRQATVTGEDVLPEYKCYSDGYLQVLIDQAPEDIRRLFDMVESGELQEMLNRYKRCVRRQWNSEGKTKTLKSRRTLNGMLCDILELDSSKVNIVRQMYQYFDLEDRYE